MGSGSLLRVPAFAGTRKRQMLGGKILMESCMKHCSAALTRLASALISFGSRLNGPAEFEGCNDIMPSARRCELVPFCGGAAEEADDDGWLTYPNFISTLNTHPRMQRTHFVTAAHTACFLVLAQTHECAFCARRPFPISLCDR